MKDNKSSNFPNPYVSNKTKDSPEYGEQVFRAILKNSGSYRSKRKKEISEARRYAQGRQPLKQYLDELNIEGNKQYTNISYEPTKVLQKFEKIVVDDYQQLQEEPKAKAVSKHIKERKEKRKSDLRFRMEFQDMIGELEQEVGFPIEDTRIKTPENEEELDLIVSLNDEEREEVLLNSLIKLVLEDNNIDRMKRSFLSDIFQTSFGGYFHYFDSKGRLRIDYIPNEDAIYSSSSLEDFSDISYAGHTTRMTIGEIREYFNVSHSDEIKLFKLARDYSGRLGNGYFSSDFSPNWRSSETRPYDEYSVEVHHIWYKTVKGVGFVEGKDSYGKTVFDIDFKIDKEERDSKKKKRKGIQYPETAYEGWFAGEKESPIVLEWGESKNQVREGANKERILCPYIFFMPDNRGDMNTLSSVQLVIPEVKMMDLAMLKIKMTIANHPPKGYAIDHESLMDLDLGTGDLSPLDVEQIFQQTGRLYYRRVSELNNVVNQNPIIPLNIEIRDVLDTYLSVYNTALNSIRETLGINPNRDGTANLSRVSTAIAQAQFSVSQTATYFIYRAYLRSTEKLIKQIGIRLLDVLKYGSSDKGYLKYLGENNIDFIKERESITSGSYKYVLDPQMTQEERERLDGVISTGLSSGALTMPDALLLGNLKDSSLAEKYVRFFTNKNKKEAEEYETRRQTEQAQAQGDMAVRTEEAKRETFQIQSSLQAQEWEIKGKNEKDVKALELATKLITAEQEGKDIPEEYKDFVTLVMENYSVKQNKSLEETIKDMEQEEVMEQQEGAIQELTQAVESGEMTEQEAQEVAEQSGIF